MDQNISLLERAFQLAKTGLYPTIVIIKKQLQKGGAIGPPRSKDRYCIVSLQR